MGGSTQCKSGHKLMSRSITFSRDIVMEKSILSRDPKEEMTRAFGYFCEDGKTSITFKDLRRVADELGDTISDEELKGSIKSATKKDDATKISLEEFLKVMENQKLM